MLWPGDARLVERDAALPGLAFVLDADGMAAWLERQAPDAGVRGARARYVRYKAATSCLVGYDVECAAGSIAVTAKAYRSPAVEKIEKALRLVDQRSALGPAAFIAPAEIAAVTVFPYDLQLRSLRRLVGSSYATVLDPMLPDIGRDVAVNVLSYKPERRLVARVDGHRGRAVVRVYSAAEFAAGAGRRIAAQPESVRLARTLAEHPRYPIVATEWLDGDAGIAPAVSARSRAIGEALAKLHAAGGAGNASWTRSADDEVRDLREAATGLADLLPKSASRIEYLSRALAESIAAAEALPVLTHGDFAMQQAVFTPGGVALTDLDQAALAHPATDIGSFIADVEYRGLIGSMTAPDTADAVASFLEGYEAVRPLPSAVEAYTAAHLLRRAPLPFRTRVPGWPGRIDDVIDRCESLPWRTGVQRGMASAARSISTTAAAPEEVAGSLDSSMPWLDIAVDAPRVSPLFSDALWDGAAISVESARILRHKPGRRCVLRYELHGSAHDAVLGKTRARGLDRRTASLNDSLYRHAFGAGSADGIEVPPFVGIVPRLRMWIQAAVPGQSAEVGLRSGDRSIARRLPEIISKLQQHGPQPARTHTIADELRILDQRLSALATRRPLLRERLARVLQGCVFLAGAPPYSPLVPAHRDFYPDQVIVGGDRLIVLDLDLYALSHPALDAGNCLAHVIELGLRPGADGSAVRDAAGELRDSIDERLPPDARPGVDVFATLTLARLIEIDDRLEHRRACVEPLIETCERRLSQARVLPSARHQVSVPAW